jgi:hypothetical protein
MCRLSDSERHRELVVLPWLLQRQERGRGVHNFPSLRINIKNHRGLVGNIPVGTPSQLVCHRFESRLGHGGSSPLPADKHSSWERKVLLLALSCFIYFIPDRFSPYR